jgi:dihydrofolate reductase
MIRLIVAHDQKRGIAKHGIQPWYLPEDEQYFNKQTTSHGAKVLVGRRTLLEVIGHPLKDRQNFVVSREQQAPQAGITFVSDLTAFLDKTKDDIWVIGGASVYEQTLSRADELYITSIEADFGCDQFFPAYDDSFTLTEKSDLHTQNGFIFSYQIYKKTA